ncbi:hypothetical protein EZJ43_00895 [Pedobacter changchengzhani]|uniref:Nucleotidyltransferase family protein n=1 Tax=Pedobacter changchengzhani TaxID=2529274 RepID=A0A4V3A0I1_9SPHI|nr:nucleotidyltransferase family protein [Pedobacter changchengzhani]TDG37683.1 hypothetical protein EZJ43_00895 [Pedobacter changchengzhani]
MLTTLALKSKYSAEQILIVLIARLYFKKTPREEVIVFLNQHEVNWALWVKMAVLHGVSTFLTHVILKEDVPIPSIYLSQLQKRKSQFGLKAMHQTMVLKQLIKDLDAENIKVLPYKGVVFSAAYFDSFLWRESTDIDLIVAEKDVIRVRKFLLNHGFTSYTDVDDRYLNHFIKYFKEITFKSPVDRLNVNCTVEIKWLLLGKFLGTYENFDFFKDHLIPFKVGELEFKKLSPTYDFMAVASNHLIKEPLHAFKYVIDLGAILHKCPNDVDADLVLKTMDKHGYQQLFLAGMTVCDDLLGINLPQWREKSIQDEILFNRPLAYPRLRGAEKLSLQILETINRFDSNKWRRMKRKFVVLYYYFIPSMLDFDLLKPSPFSLLFLYVIRPFRLLKKALFG